METEVPKLKSRLLVLVENYVSSKSISMAFVHSRLIEYPKDEFDITVGSFSAGEAYQIDGIKVVPVSPFSGKNIGKFDLVLLHAPNLRHHILFLLSYYLSWNAAVFFFHGHEVLVRHRYYPRPYNYLPKSNFRWLAEMIYDPIKVKILALFFRFMPRWRHLTFIFVSQWMLNEFEKCLHFVPSKNNTYIVHNPIHLAFQKEKYNFNSAKVGDFVTIRSLDAKKYAIDLVVDFARANPGYSFHIFGTGSYFQFNEIPPNVIHHKHGLRQTEIPGILNQYRCALMPTRLDAQGVMMCEMASFGMPVVTTDISICREMLGEFRNARFLPVGNFAQSQAGAFLTGFDSKVPGIQHFDFKNTTLREIQIIRELLSAGEVNK